MRKYWLRAAERLSQNRVIRALLGLFFAALLIFAISLGKGQSPVFIYEEGSIAPQDINAPFLIVLEGEIDQPETAKLQEQALAGVKAVYQFDGEVEKKTRDKIDAFFARLKQVRKEGSDDFPELAPDAGLEISPTAFKTFLGLADFDEIKGVVVEISEELTSRPIVSVDTKEELRKDKAEAIALLREEGEEIVELENVLSTSEAERRLESAVALRFPEERKIRAAIQELFQRVVDENIFFNAEETTRRRKEAVASVPMKYHTRDFKKGEGIVDRGERITKTHIKYLTRINQELLRRRPSSARYLSLSALGILVLILLTIIAIYLKKYEPQIYADNRSLLLLGFLGLILVLLAKLIIFKGFSPYLIPVAMVSMLLAILLGSRVSLMITLVLSIIAGIISGNRFEIMLVSLIGGVIGIYSVLQIRRRSQFLWAGLKVAGVSFVSILSIAILAQLEFFYPVEKVGALIARIIRQDALWGIANGFISVSLVAITLPVFEYLSKTITNISLLELSDLNHPLLKKLTVDALGTYHHSLIVGNLAEVACETVGANSLLARVASYYHDIGKIDKPEYFSENQKEGVSGHERLSPQMSRLVILNHVREGVELAKKHHLNPAIINFIAEHHGTSLLHYFYQKALEEAGGEKEVDKSDFRYPGPKPQTRESAIVLLADSVEAASRSLDEPTPAQIEELVRKIVNNKFIDGQLDECDLSLKNLHRISDSFIRLLSGIHHSRIKYEEREEVGSKGKRKKPEFSL